MSSDAEINERLRTGGFADSLQGIGREGLIKLWREFVKEVETGYSGVVEEYWNDLDIREIIQYCTLADDPEVVELDNRLRTHLEDTKRKIWTSAYPDAFWVYGYPSSMSEEFEGMDPRP